MVSTGTQYSIRSGTQEAVITEVGANLRVYRDGDRDVITSFEPDQLPPASHGAVLLPWPNRLADGRYTFQGVTYQLPINEPERNTALHGLATWTRWDLVDHTLDSVTLSLDLVPTPGYPFALSAAITYRLDDFGLGVRLVVRNGSDDDAPYGVGFHPWLSPGGYSLDECTIRVDAATHVIADPERLLPLGLEPVAGDWDLREHTSLAGLDLDDAWVDVERDEDGLSWVELAAPDGRVAAVWLDHTAVAWQVCSGDHVPAVDWRRTGLAAEPMTCIANAFANGERLIVLEPGDTHTITWGAVLR